jgi:mandelamide amidase
MAAMFVSIPGEQSDPDAAPLWRLGAGEAVERMSRGEITVERYASVLLARCKKAAPLNAFITLEPDRVLQAARECDGHRHKGGKTGPLFGLPIPVKDSVNTKDYPTTAGTPALRHFRPAEDAPVVKALRENGAIVLGKTNLHELSWGWSRTAADHKSRVRSSNPLWRHIGERLGGDLKRVQARGVIEDLRGDD